MQDAAPLRRIRTYVLSRQLPLAGSEPTNGGGCWPCSGEFWARRPCSSPMLTTRGASITCRPSRAWTFGGHRSGAFESVIDTITGQTAYFISADDLIASKLASGRPH